MIGCQLQLSSQCHICSLNPNSIENNMLFKVCINKTCNKLFCIQCIKKHFDSQITLQRFNHLNYWTCYSCQNNCKCPKCNESQPKNTYYANMLQKKTKIQKNDQTSLDKNSIKNAKHSRISEKGESEIINFIQNEYKYSQNHENNYQINDSSEEFIPKFEQNKQKKPKIKRFKQQSSIFQNQRDQSHSPFENSSQIVSHPPYQKFRAIAKPKKQRSIMGLKIENGKLPPYLESIMKRKRTFIKFMEKHSKKSYQQLLQQQNTWNKEKTIQKNGQLDNNPSPIILSPPSVIYGLDSFVSPSQMPQTPSFLPVSEPLAPVGSVLKLSELLGDKLKEYEMEQDDLSLQLL